MRDRRRALARFTLRVCRGQGGDQVGGLALLLETRHSLVLLPGLTSNVSSVLTLYSSGRLSSVISTSGAPGPWCSGRLPTTTGAEICTRLFPGIVCTSYRPAWMGTVTGAAAPSVATKDIDPFSRSLPST